jgi:hypothetical protein
MKLQRLQNTVHCTIDKLSKTFTDHREIHVVFSIPYIYGFITRLCRQQADVIRNHENAYIGRIGINAVAHRKGKRLKLCGGRAYNSSDSEASLVT